MVGVRERSDPHPVVRESRLWPRQGSPAVSLLGMGPRLTGCPTSEQGATLAAHIYIVNLVKIAHPYTAVDDKPHFGGYFWVKIYQNQPD